MPVVRAAEAAEAVLTGATRAPSYPHCPVGLTDRSGSLLGVAHRTASYPVGRTVQFRGENRRDSRLSRGENRLNY